MQLGCNGWPPLGMKADSANSPCFQILQVIGGKGNEIARNGQIYFGDYSAQGGLFSIP